MSNLDLLGLRLSISTTRIILTSYLTLKEIRHAWWIATEYSKMLVIWTCCIYWDVFLPWATWLSPSHYSLCHPDSRITCLHDSRLYSLWDTCMRFGKWTRKGSHYFLVGCMGRSLDLGSLQIIFRIEGSRSYWWQGSYNPYSSRFPEIQLWPSWSFLSQVFNSCISLKFLVLKYFLFIIPRVTAVFMTDRLFKDTVVLVVVTPGR